MKSSSGLIFISVSETCLLIHAILCYQESFDASEIRMRHLQAAIRQVQPSEIQSYEVLAEKFRRIVASIGKEEK